MSTTVQYGTAHTHTTLASAIGAFVNGGFIISGYNDSNTPASEQITVGGNSATNYMRLTAAAGQSLFDNVANPLRYDATKGVALEFNPAFDAVIDANDYFFIDRWQVRNSRGTNSNGVLHGAAFANLIESSGNLYQNETAVNGDHSTIEFNGSGKSTNDTLVTWFQHGVDVRNGGIILANDTIVAPFDKSNTQSAFFTNGSGTTRFVNNAVFGFASLGVTSPQVASGSTKNATDLSSMIGTSPITSLSFTAQFNAISTTGPLDLRPKSGNGLVAGATDTTDIPSGLDAFGVTRAATWTIGAMEFAGTTTQNITLTLAALKFAGFPLAVNGKSQFGIVQGTLKFAGFPLGANGKSQVTVTQALLKFVGFVPSVNVGTVLSVILAPLKFAGFALGANAKSALNIVKAPIVFAGRALTVSGAVSLAIAQATIVFSGRILNFVGGSVARMLALLGVGL